jgi:hypothetical protein
VGFPQLFKGTPRAVPDKSEIAQDKFIIKSGFVLKKEKMLTSIRTLLGVLFFLAAGGATRDGAFLLSEAELIRFGSDVAYLDIS